MSARWISVATFLATVLLCGAISQAAISDGLMAYWALDGNFQDTGFNSNFLHGEQRGTNPIAFAPGKFGQGIDLDGTNQYVEITGGAGNELDFVGGSMSVSAWFRVDAFDTNWQAIVAKGEQDGWRLHRDEGRSGIAFTAGEPDVATTVNVNDGEIHHVVATSNLGFKSLYLDGALVATGQRDAIGIPDSNQRVRIGDNPSAPGREWNGLIDDMAIWNRALTENEVAEIWADGSGRSIASLTVIPEPSSIVLAVLGVIGAGYIGWRRRRRKA